MKNSAKGYSMTHIDPKKGFRIHVLVFALTIPVIWLTWLLTDRTYLWPVWQISAWGIGLLSHYLGVFVFKNKKKVLKVKVMKINKNLSISRALVFFTALFLLNNTFAMAQNSNKIQMEALAKITRYEVKKEYQESFQKVVRDYVLKSLTNESNIMSEAYFEQENEAVIWLFERWISQNEWNKFKNDSKSKAVKTLVKTALVMPEKIIAIKDLEPISKQEWRRPSKKEDEQLTIMLFVDGKAGTEENFKEVYKTAMPQFRSEPGVVTYQLSQFENDKTQFVTFEKFRSKDAFQYHLNFPPIQPVLDYLNTSIKKPPFQDGIHNLIEFAPLTRE